MILDKKMTTVAYRCPACGMTVKSVMGAFVLGGDLVRLKCPCGESEMTVEHKRDGKMRLTVPCFLCPKPHIFTVSENIFYSKDIFSLPCSYTGVDIGFLGEAEQVEKAIEESDLLLAEMLGENDFSDLSCGKKESVFDDPQILDIILYVIGDLAEEKKIYCGCEPGEGRYEVSVTDSSVIVTCKECGKSVEIPAGSTLAANAFLHTDELTLS
ncbi:MAG: hypothetical protein E7660_00415 [Ruminococcaceae bacterium]|nr:hypothetical protein [Oscillospiraceae bacterium]